MPCTYGLASKWRPYARTHVMLYHSCRRLEYDYKILVAQTPQSGTEQVLEALLHNQYLVRVDGSGRLTRHNRQHLRYIQALGSVQVDHLPPTLAWPSIVHRPPEPEPPEANTPTLCHMQQPLAQRDPMPGRLLPNTTLSQPANTGTTASPPTTPKPLDPTPTQDCQNSTYLPP